MKIIPNNEQQVVSQQNNEHSIQQSTDIETSHQTEISLESERIINERAVVERKEMYMTLIFDPTHCIFSQRIFSPYFGNYSVAAFGDLSTEPHPT